MTRENWLKYGQFMLVVLGIIAGTTIAKLAAGPGWWAMAGPGLVALSFVCADLMEARLRHERPVPSFDVLILGGVFLVGGLIVALHGSSLELFIPLTGGVYWIGVLSRADRNRRACRYL